MKIAFALGSNLCHPYNKLNRRRISQIDPLAWTDIHENYLLFWHIWPLNMYTISKMHLNRLKSPLMFCQKPGSTFIYKLNSAGASCLKKKMNSILMLNEKTSFRIFEKSWRLAIIINHTEHFTGNETTSAHLAARADRAIRNDFLASIFSVCGWKINFLHFQPVTLSCSLLASQCLEKYYNSLVTLD